VAGDRMDRPPYRRPYVRHRPPPGP
jgi:hypothetical protein